MMKIYLDHAAATPVDDKVVAVMTPYYSDMFYNPSALYSGAREAKKALEEARATVASCVGSRPSEILFTAGGTESANLAIKGVMDVYPDANCVVSAIEHEAVLQPARRYSHSIVPVKNNGLVSIDELAVCINEQTVLLSIMLANNEIGTVQQLKEITKIAENVRQKRHESGNKLPLYVHTDACQAPLYIDYNVARSGVDMMTLNGGKIHGPKQSGILYKKSSVVLQAQIEGGGQEYGLRSGTENVAQAVGFAKALSLSEKDKSNRVAKTRDLRDYFMEQLETRFKAEITGHRQKRLANNIHVYFPHADNERVLFALDDMGIAAAAGSACQASSDSSSHVLKALGYPDSYAHSSVRFSLGRDTTKEDIDETLRSLETALKA